jgi:hypothetical protein
MWSRANLVALMTAVSKSYPDVPEQELFGRIADTMRVHLKRASPADQAQARTSPETETPNIAAACAKFVMWALSEGSWQGADIAGGAAQDKAAELGLIAETTYDPNRHGPSDVAEIGDSWFVPTEAMAALMCGHAQSPGLNKQVDDETLADFLADNGMLAVGEDDELGMAQALLREFNITAKAQGPDLNAERITRAVLKTLAAGGDNLKIYEAVRDAVAGSDTSTIRQMNEEGK